MEMQQLRHSRYGAHDGDCACRRARELPPIRTLALAGIVLGSIGGGALLGAALTAFLLPTSRAELRRKLAQFLAAPNEEEEEAGAEELDSYDSGEHVVEDLERPGHHESDYPWVAQPRGEDDAPPAVEEAQGDPPFAHDDSRG